jgi:hypothetical protein
MGERSASGRGPEARMNPMLSYASAMPGCSHLRLVFGAAGGGKARARECLANLLP